MAKPIREAVIVPAKAARAQGSNCVRAVFFFRSYEPEKSLSAETWELPDIEHVN
jgi:hypothetical protein